MNKLYNLYEQVILEFEGAVKLSSIQDVINKNLAVSFEYNDGSSKPNLGMRYVQVVAMGKTSKGNNAIRGYQINGPHIKTNKSGNEVRWKTFLTNNIKNWTPKNFTFYSPPDELFNALGDKTLNLPDSGGVTNMAIFGGKPLEKYREKYTGWKSDLETKKANEPEVVNRNTTQSEPVNRNTAEPELKVGNNKPDYPTKVISVPNNDTEEVDDELDIEEI